MREGEKLLLDIDHPDRIYINEAKAYKHHKISCINVPNEGCDMVGYIYLPESLGGGYLFGGDYCGQESGIRDYEANICRRFERKAGVTASIVLCDIDYFKKVNDTYGHIQGDLVLHEVGNILGNSMRKHFDVAGRYGGEEFLLVLDETDADETFRVVERIREKIAAHRFTKCDAAGKPVEDEFLSITMSFGIAEITGKMESCDTSEWLSRADMMLYQSKKNGGTHVLGATGQFVLVAADAVDSGLDG